jgi:hypothetical protein
MTDQSRLVRDAAAVGARLVVPQHQESLTEQLDDLLTLAVLFGLYDAADYLRERAAFEGCSAHSTAAILAEADRFNAMQRRALAAEGQLNERNP